MEIQSDWCKTFFAGLALDLWRAAITSDQTRQEADSIEGRLRVRPGHRLLDVACGGGRLALELASRGYDLTAVDISAEFLTEAQAKAAEARLKIRWEQREMRDLPWPGAFDGVICFGNSFAYLDDEGNAAFLAAVARALKPGGRLVMDTLCAEMLLPNFQERTWFQAGSVIMLEENRYDLDRGRFETDYTFIKEGEMEKKSGSQRLYTYSELRRLLENAGLTEIEGYGSLHLEPFALASHRLFLVARKPHTVAT